MINVPTNSEYLKQAGLTDYEVRVYLALLKFGLLGGQECAKYSEVPPTRVYASLKLLVEKGLASQIREKPLLFKAIPPEIGLKSLFDSKLTKLKSISKDAIDSLKRIKAESTTKPKLHEKITVIFGFEKMFAHFVEWINSAKGEVLVYSVGEEVPYSIRLAVRKAVSKGVLCKLVASKYDGENKLILKSHVSDGWQVKHYLGAQDFTFGIVDGKQAMLNVRNPQEKEERISIFFETPELAKHLKAYFESLWEKAKAI